MDGDLGTGELLLGVLGDLLGVGVQNVVARLNQRDRDLIAEKLGVLLSVSVGIQ